MTVREQKEGMPAKPPRRNGTLSKGFQLMDHNEMDSTGQNCGVTQVRCAL